jgi:hypothetical protein
METLDFAPETSVSTLKKITPGFITAGSDINKMTANRVVNYFLDVLGEGVKQNFLGPNIDMEFLMLSFRVYAVQLASVTVSYLKKIPVYKYPAESTGYGLRKNTAYPSFN